MPQRKIKAAFFYAILSIIISAIVLYFTSRDYKFSHYSKINTVQTPVYVEILAREKISFFPKWIEKFIVWLFAR